ncbi:MAG: hypothetical protein CVT88_03250 [Candidatus Altiarchaeales archaeon HGW-Altiarchaeales-1]|nr:MAG: hypothetical protein CVT89_05520 [Candidatus Altiarchaeales archaeon HGW-Altiarchaeales-2]PKP60373.1 MAG: hypothetical protein CVT88_03250 [Candidatus Altiarchaeales archaeon HGW-Altiarchaeales-1]
MLEHFFWVKYVEEVGTGTNKLIDWCKRWDLPEPDFEFTGTSIVVTFRKSKLTDEYLSALELNERQIKAVEYVKNNKEIDNKTYRKLNDIGKVISAKELNDMVIKKILKIAGEGRARKYVLNDLND